MDMPDELRTICGGKTEMANLHLLAQLANATLPADVEAGLLLAGCRPKGDLQAMLAAQLVAVHHIAMGSFAAARQCPAEDLRQTLIADAVEQCRVFSQQVRALVALREMEAGHE